MHTTPASLLERLRRPQAQADWERFVALYTPLLCYWANQLGVTGSDAEDLVQDVFTVLVKKLPDFRYDPHQRFRGWLWTILANKVRTSRRPRAPVRSVDERVLLAVPEQPSAAEEEEYRHYLVQRALEILRGEFQATTWQAFHLLTSGERPDAVAEKLGLSLPAVYAVKSRVLRRLRQELDGLLD